MGDILMYTDGDDILGDDDDDVGFVSERNGQKLLVYL